MNEFALASADGTRIACMGWPAEGKARGIVQIAHGMGEHALRYARPAEALTRAGFHVYANDHRGHGRSAPSKDALGDFGRGGWDGLVADMVMLTERARREAPGQPVVLLGHSMGSFAAQQYVLDHSALIDGLVLSGSAAADRLGLAADREVDLTAINAAFEPARTPFDWLSRDDAEVDKYIADPLCGFGVNRDATRSMAASLARTADPKEIARIRKDLPVYIFAGDKDPVNGNLEFLKPVAARYRAAGLRDVTEKYYPSGRHEMFNETNRDEVVSDLISWLDRAI
ncbi:MAG: lysophospholipase [Alphaproteobacteria bacterium]|nr:lysophospholipase [Alphaproteobacteria bacterium]